MSRDPRYDILFEPVQIGPVTARNRFLVRATRWVWGGETGERLIWAASVRVLTPIALATYSGYQAIRSAGREGAHHRRTSTQHPWNNTPITQARPLHAPFRERPQARRVVCQPGAPVSRNGSQAREHRSR